MERVRTFPVVPGFLLRLQDLSANVIVQAIERGSVQMTLEGDEELLSGIATELPSPQELVILETPRIGARTTVIVVDGSVSVIGSVSGSISVRNGIVTINGKRVTESTSEINIVHELPTVRLLVPKGINLEIMQSAKVRASGPFGHLRVSASAQSRLEIDQVASVDAKSSGQSTVKVKGVSDPKAPAKLRSSGQSTIEVSGVFGDTEVESSGQSTIRLDGNCVSLNAESSGQSNIRHNGNVAGSCRVHSSGQSTIR